MPWTDFLDLVLRPNPGGDGGQVRFPSYFTIMDQEHELAGRRWEIAKDVVPMVKVKTAKGRIHDHWTCGPASSSKAVDQGQGHDLLRPSTADCYRIPMLINDGEAIVSIDFQPAVGFLCRQGLKGFGSPGGDT